MCVKGDLPQHLQVMINTLRSEDRIKLVGVTVWFILLKEQFIISKTLAFIAHLLMDCLHQQVVRLESSWTDHVRYMVVVYTNGRQDTEENILLGMDFTDKDR